MNQDNKPHKGLSASVNLSPRTQELLKDYLKGGPSAQLEKKDSKIDWDDLIAWLNTPIGIDLEAELELVVASLCVELLKDLRSSLPGTIENTPVDANIGADNRVQFILLVFAGTLVAACEGFDGVTTILSVLSLPAVFVFIAGLAFSLLSILVFCGFDLIQVSRQLNINVMDAPKLLDSYLDQMKEIKLLRNRIESYTLASLTLAELEELQRIICMLEWRLTALKKSSSQFNIALNSPSIHFMKSTFTIMAGLLFFGGGFFAGQSVAVFVLGLFASSIPAFWPVVLFSCLVGLAALTVYWYMERPALQKLISGWVGLDEDKIERLCDERKFKKEEIKLERLKHQVADILKLKPELNDVSDKSDPVLGATSAAGKSRYSFHSASIAKAAEHSDGICAVVCLNN
ncbi:MAG: hypothetical protein ACHP6H_05795 [Legionellales bacterium]